jgi:tetrahydromethanopterin S-methyltransferase subunit G
MNEKIFQSIGQDISDIKTSVDELKSKETFDQISNDEFNEGQQRLIDLNQKLDNLAGAVGEFKAWYATLSLLGILLGILVLITTILKRIGI